MCVWHLVGSDSDSYMKGKGSRDRDRDSGKKEAHIHTDTHSVGRHTRTVFFLWKFCCHHHFAKATGRGGMKGSGRGKMELKRPQPALSAAKLSGCHFCEMCSRCRSCHCHCPCCSCCCCCCPSSVFNFICHLLLLMTHPSAPTHLRPWPIRVLFFHLVFFFWYYLSGYSPWDVLAAEKLLSGPPAARRKREWVSDRHKERERDRVGERGRGRECCVWQGHRMLNDI